MTASGGEAMLQQEFIAELFTACKAQGIHTCLDTNGFVRHYDELLDRVLDNTDLVLLDIKQINDEKHIPLTHVSNKYTLEFARYLASRGQTMWIRYVVVPTWSDDDESAEGLGQFIAELGECVEKVELLPYHELGKHKWDVLGDTYDLVGIKPQQGDHGQGPGHPWQVSPQREVLRQEAARQRAASFHCAGIRHGAITDSRIRGTAHE